VKKEEKRQLLMTGGEVKTVARKEGESGRGRSRVEGGGGRVREELCKLRNYAIVGLIIPPVRADCSLLTSPSGYLQVTIFTTGVKGTKTAEAKKSVSLKVQSHQVFPRAAAVSIE
jgi:hypothetical protein